MATRTTPTETRQITRADVDAHRRALRTIENHMHDYAERSCSQEPDDRNGTRRMYSSILSGWIDLDSDDDDARQDAAVIDKIARILGYRPVGLFVNGDPRGYALKVQPEHAGDLRKDWGGYGLLAPDK